jgi:hypothetical protein
MQRLEAKISPERPLLSAETGIVENRRQDPRRNGLFSIDDGFRGSARLDGGVRSHMRTGLRFENGVLRELTGQICEFGPFFWGEKRSSPVFTGLSAQNSRATCTGIFIAPMGKLSSRYANKAAKIAIARLAALSNSLGLNQAALVAIDRSTSLPASWF